MALNFGSIGRYFNLPELEISERFGGNKSSLKNKKAQNLSSAAFWGAKALTGGSGGGSKQQVLGNTTNATSTSRPTDTSSSVVNTTSSSKSNYKDIDRGTKDEKEVAEADNAAFLKEIENEYNNTMNVANDAQSQLESQIPLTEGQITQSYDSAVPGLQMEQGQKIADLGTQEATGRQESKGVMSKIGQTYNELLSGAQKFGGSAAEGFGELLGRSTAQGLSEARNNLATLVTNIKGEIGRVNQFYNQKMNDLQQNKILAIEQARQDLRTEIAKINTSKIAAAGAKAHQNMVALASFKEVIAGINSAATLAKRNLDLFNEQKQETLRQTAADKAQEYKLTLAQALEQGKFRNSVTGAQESNPQTWLQNVGLTTNDPNWKDPWAQQTGSTGADQVPDNLKNLFPEG